MAAPWRVMAAGIRAVRRPGRRLRSVRRTRPGRVDSDHVIGIHVNAATVGFIPLGAVREDKSSLSEVERARLDADGQLPHEGNGYFSIRRLGPDTLFALTDSPVGQLA